MTFELADGKTLRWKEGGHTAVKALLTTLLSSPIRKACSREGDWIVVYFPSLR